MVSYMYQLKIWNEKDEGEKEQVGDYCFNSLLQSIEFDGKTCQIEPLI